MCDTMNGIRVDEFAAAPSELLEPDDDEDEAGDGIGLRHIARGNRSIQTSLAPRTLFHFPRGEEEPWDSTRSLHETDVVYHWIGGRRYCDEYYMPNDEDEQTRLQMLHGIYLWIFNNKLTLVPLKNPTKIVDVGTGTGEWAMAMGELYPSAEVIGTDIAKIQPKAVPLNVFMEIDDADIEGGWTWNDKDFDLVHFRYMAGAFRDWTHIYRETYRVLKPGGWIEVVDFDQHDLLRSFFVEGDNTIVLSWLDALAEAQKICGRPRSVDHLEPSSLTTLGFVDVEQHVYDIPMGSWPDEPELQALGKQFLVAQLCAIEAMCMRPLVEQLGWDEEDVRSVCCQITERVRSMALDPVKAKGLGMRLKVVMGRKPGGEMTKEAVGGGIAEVSGLHAVVNGQDTGADTGTNMDIYSKFVDGIGARPVQEVAMPNSG